MINCDDDCDSIFLASKDRAIHLSVFFVSFSPNIILIYIYITFLDINIIVSILYFILILLPRVKSIWFE